MSEKKLFLVDQNIQVRADKYLAKKMNGYSRSRIQDLFVSKNVFVDGNPVKKSYQLSKGERITVKIPEPDEPEIEPVKMNLDILFEDDDIIVLNKPSGLVVHPAPGTDEPTLLHGLLYHTRGLSSIGGVKRPGIVHRLDKDTSGVMVIAKTDKSHKNLSLQFKNREVTKFYRTVVEGKLKYFSGKIEAPIGRNPDNRTKMAVIEKNSRQAITYFKELDYSSDYTYIEAKPLTGRTHQIRVHLSYMGHPVVGDRKYGKAGKADRHLLHAFLL